MEGQIIPKLVLRGTTRLAFSRYVTSETSIRPFTIEALEEKFNPGGPALWTNGVRYYLIKKLYPNITNVLFCNEENDIWRDVDHSVDRMVLYFANDDDLLEFILMWPSELPNP